MFRSQQELIPGTQNEGIEYRPGLSKIHSNEPQKLILNLRKMDKERAHQLVKALDKNTSLQDVEFRGIWDFQLFSNFDSLTPAFQLSKTLTSLSFSDYPLRNWE